MSDLHDDHPDLVALLRGQLSTAEVLDAEDHVDSCLRCRDAFVATAVGHVLLTRSAQALADPTVSAELPAVPPLRPPRQGRRPRPATLAAAAAVLVAGAGLGSLVTTVATDDPDRVDPPPAATVAAPLDAVDGSGSGEVVMTLGSDASTQMTVQTADLPPPPDGAFYYVWLLDPRTNKMLPLGLVEPGGTATFRVDAALVASYGAVDVSLEADDGDPAHSVTSVLRGSYELT